jgi:hypothetical protein
MHRVTVVITLHDRWPLEWSAHVRAVMYDEARYSDVERALPDALGRTLARIIYQLELRDILAFGAGLTSVICAEALTGLGGGRLTVIEDDAAWDVEQWAQVAAKRTVDAQLIASPLFFRLSLGPYHGYGSGAATGVASRGPYSLVLIDPPHGFFSRDGTLHLAMPHLAPGALILVRKERDTVDRWLDTYPGLVMLYRDRVLGDGIAVMGYTGNPARRLSSRAIITGAMREASGWIARRSGTSGAVAVQVDDDQQQRNEAGVSAGHSG